MKRIATLLLLTVVIEARLIAQPNTHRAGLAQEVVRLLDAASLKFSLPAGFRPTAVRTTGDVHYDFAVKAEAVKLEVRYAVRLLAGEVKRHREAVRTGESSTDPNALFEPYLLAVCLNLSNGRMPELTRFNASDVHEEFGADAGATALVRLDSDFGSGFGFCMVVALHRDDLADAFIFFLFDNLSEVQDLLFRDDIFHALVFKRE